MIGKLRSPKSGCVYCPEMRKYHMRIHLKSTFPEQIQWYKAFCHPSAAQNYRIITKMLLTTSQKFIPNISGNKITKKLINSGKHRCEKKCFIILNNLYLHLPSDCNRNRMFKKHILPVIFSTKNPFVGKIFHLWII